MRGRRRGGQLPCGTCGADLLAFFGGEAFLGSYEALALNDDPTNRLDGGERGAVDKSTDCVGEVGLGSDVHGKAMVRLMS